MSLSAFKAAFAAGMDEAPMRYVTRLRMALAAEALRTTGAPVAARFGYESEASFGEAFKRHHGAAPGTCRQGRHAVERVRTCRAAR